MLGLLANPLVVIFGFAPPPPGYLGFVAVAACTQLVVVELVKRLIGSP